MQTFVPSPIITETVECLDYRRLGKQRVEAFQIIKALTVPDYGWKNHPATRMWVDCVPALKWYYNHCVREWVSRGYNNTMELYEVDSKLYELPPWIGNEEFHKSHRMNLLRKDYDFYSEKFDEVATTYEIESYPYWWPTENGYL